MRGVKYQHRLEERKRLQQLGITTGRRHEDGVRAFGLGLKKPMGAGLAVTGGDGGGRGEEEEEAEEEKGRKD